MSKGKKPVGFCSVTWDEKAKAIYVEVGKGKVQRTLETSIDHVPIIISVDVDKNENLIGVEILL